MNQPRAPRVVVLAGATASGKTDLAVRAAVAASVPVEIVSLDSRQLYRELDVATGKPDRSQRAAVAHHLLDLLEAHERPDAMWYRCRAEDVLRDLFARGVVPLLVGGSGFYLRALREGFHAIAADDAALADVRHRVAALDDATLHATLAALDPVTASRLHAHDRYRLGRALEIAWLTGEKPSALSARFAPSPVLGATFDVYVTRCARSTLHTRIALRTRRWLAGGWRPEVEGMLGRGIAPDAPALRTLGYREVVRWIAGEIDAGRAEESIVVATRRYARQQETWFRKEGGAHPLDPTDEAGLRAALEAAAA